MSERRAVEHRNESEMNTVGRYERIFPPSFEPFQSRPTVFPGGIERMIRIWERSRERNRGGYGSGVLFDVFGHRRSTVTSCSPWTSSATPPPAC